MSRKCSVRWDQEYKYSYVEGPLITRRHVDLLLEASRKRLSEVEVSLDLGLTRSIVRIESNSVVIDSVRFSLDYLDKTVEEGFVYKIVDEKILRIDLYSEGRYYKLKFVDLDKAPTLEINGVQMHRTTNIDPWRDSLLKVASLGRVRGFRVLDICTGLGYTAINALRRGSREVISIEIDRNVLEIARLNPWSRDLDKIRILEGDATRVIHYIDDECFQAVTHDPPRINVAGELYSESFYREIFRVLVSGGRMFHYTGEPGKHSNISILRGIKNRLEKAGFINVRWIDRAKGFLAVKP
ncbi:MAG: methyltransferase domain-containing protein [Sulfolobales archaeon]